MSVQQVTVRPWWRRSIQRGQTLPWAAAVAVLLAWTLVFVISAVLVDRRRDIAWTWDGSF